MAIINSIIGNDIPQSSDTRVVNKYKESYQVYIGRGSIWGNPFTVQEHGRDAAISMYEIHIRERLKNEPELVRQLLNLKGNTLGCFCKPQPCHGDILIKLIEEYSTIE